jgi:hypothetical protein
VTALSDAVTADQQQTHQQLRHIMHQIERLDELLRTPAAVTERDPNDSRKLAAISRLEPADTTPISPNNVDIALSSIDTRQTRSVSHASPTFLLQQDNRPPSINEDGLPDHEQHRQQQQQKMFVEDVTSRISTLRDLFACVICFLSKSSTILKDFFDGTDTAAGA